MAFLNSCQVYICLCPNSFMDKQAKIVWAMSYMKAGRAAKWSAHIFWSEEQLENVGYHKFINWEDFQDEFKREFCPVYADSVAINRLESTAYFQKSHSVDEYLDEFQDLITEAGYSNPKTIVVKFCWGLDTQIQNAIATMPSGCPSDMVPTDWYTAARTIDQNQATVTTLFLLSLLLWTLELYSILSYRYEDLLISWSYRSYLGDLIWSLDLIIWWWSKICFFISTLHYYLHAFDMPLTHVFHWWLTCILHMLLRNMLLPYTWHALNICFTCVCLEDNTWTLVYNRS